MGTLAWSELIVLWGFAVLVTILDRKNWQNKDQQQKDLLKK